jgi:hypothetical protein
MPYKVIMNTPMCNAIKQSFYVYRNKKTYYKKHENCVMLLLFNDDLSLTICVYLGLTCITTGRYPISPCFLGVRLLTQYIAPTTKEVLVLMAGIGAMCLLQADRYQGSTDVTQSSASM